MGYCSGKVYKIVNIMGLDRDQVLYSTENEQTAYVMLMAFKTEHPNWNIRLKSYDNHLM